MALASSTVDPAKLAYHEVRAPIALMATAAWFAAEDCTDPVTRARVEAIATVAERLLSSVASVLEPSQGSEQWRAFDPAPIVRRFARAWRELDWTVQEGQLDGSICEGDPRCFESLLQCVFNNCLDHADSSQPIVIDMAREEGEVVVEISNTRASVRRHQGLGLGRFIAASLARNCGARLGYTCGEDSYTVSIRMQPAIACGLAER